MAEKKKVDCGFCGKSVSNLQTHLEKDHPIPDVSGLHGENGRLRIKFKDDPIALKAHFGVYHKGKKEPFDQMELGGQVVQRVPYDEKREGQRVVRR